MSPDEEGFSYPVIDPNMCDNCALCKEVCGFQKEKLIDTDSEPPLVFAAKIHNESVRANSSSGGAFTALSDWILKKDGVVFGVELDETLTAVTTFTETPQGRDRFRGSKYIQSELRDSFNDIQSFLLSQRSVMFSGTPCQAEALQNYCKSIDTSKLYICDIVCYGTPPQQLFKEYLSFLERQENDKVIDYYFRYKNQGWHEHTEMQVYSSGKKDYKSGKSQVFKMFFNGNVCLRPSCHNCKYTSFNRNSDITIADFWGIQRTMPDFDDDKGVSLILVNSDKGSEWLTGISDTLKLRESNTKDCIQPSLRRPTSKSDRREQFWIDYKKKSFDYIARKYGGLGLKGRCRAFTRSFLKRIGLLGHIRRLVRRSGN